MSSRDTMNRAAFAAVANLEGMVRGAGFVSWPSQPAAAEVVQARIVRTLHAWGTPLDLQNDDGDTLLHVASREGAVSTVRALVVAGAKLDVRNGQGRTALDEADACRHEVIAQCLRSAAMAN